MTASLMYSQDYDEQCLYNWYEGPIGGTFYTWMELLNPYIKNTGVYTCPSAPTSEANYGSFPAGTAMTSTYCMMAWIPYSYWGFPIGAVFGGTPFPSNVSNSGVCAEPWSDCVSPNFSQHPADSMYVHEGYLVAYYPVAGVTFGSAYTTGTDFSDTNPLFVRHNGFQNVGFADGHCKASRSLFTVATATTGGTYSGYPLLNLQRVGP